MYRQTVGKIDRPSNSKPAPSKVRSRGKDWTKSACQKCEVLRKNGQRMSIVSFNFYSLDYPDIFRLVLYFSHIFDLIFVINLKSIWFLNKCLIHLPRQSIFEFCLGWHWICLVQNISSFLKSHLYLHQYFNLHVCPFFCHRRVSPFRVSHSMGTALK